MRKKKSMCVLCMALAASMIIILPGCSKTSSDQTTEPDFSVSMVEEDGDDAPVQKAGKIWDYLDPEVADFAAGFAAADMDSLRLSVQGDQTESYVTYDEDLIGQIFLAMDAIQVGEATQENVADSDQTFTFITKTDEEYRIDFNDNNLSTSSGNYFLENDADLWDLAIDLRERADESYVDAYQAGQTDPESVDTDPEDPQNERADRAQSGVAHFSYSQESTGSGTEYIFGDALVITIPADWSGKYSLSTSDNSVTFYHTASHERWLEEDGSDGGVLFGIYYSSDGDGDVLGMAQDGGYYCMSVPSDLQAFEGDEDILNEYASLADQIDSIEGSAFSNVSE